MTERRQRTDRVISVNREIHAKLTAVQAALTGRLGFTPTLAQTIEYMCEKVK